MLIENYRLWIRYVPVLVFLFFMHAAIADTADGIITVDTQHPVNHFNPSQALGVGVDGLDRGIVARVYTPPNLKAMQSAGLGALTYRLRTELGVEAWHWNPQGTWSDPKHQQGYWTSDDHSSTPILQCYGYRLPRRGSTIDQANNDGYSRLDDGDPSTFWKSNPYLDKHFTHEDNALHPQWVVVNLGHVQPVDAIRLQWAAPYATHYQVQYWTAPNNSDPEAISDTFDADGKWLPFPDGTVTQGHGGDITLRLSSQPISARYLRIWMTESSEDGPSDTGDIRDRIGYALCEIGVGVLDEQGNFHDIITHASDRQEQTIMVVSSTDPWHRASDRDPNTEQPGFDRVFQSGLTRNMPVLMPVGILYDIPSNAAAEIRYLKSHHYPVTHVELGEEPDGQVVRPEDYSTFYQEFAHTLHQLEPKLQLGGPAFQTDIGGWVTWTDAHGDRSWIRRFRNDLIKHHRLSDFQFFSFEWYPFDNVCAPPAPQLAQETALLGKAMERVHQQGIPPSFPIFITEYGFSAFGGQAEVELPGALLNADLVGQFLTLGGSRTYLYGYEPNILIREDMGCDTWGNLALLLADRQRHIQFRLPTYWAAWLMTQQWVEPGGGQHILYAADVSDKHNTALVTAYTVRRPDDQWSVLLINKDPVQVHRFRIQFHASSSHRFSHFVGLVEQYHYSGAQYLWKVDGRNGHPLRDLPPVQRHLPMLSTVTLPPYSLTVLRGTVR